MNDLHARPTDKILLKPHVRVSRWASRAQVTKAVDPRGRHGGTDDNGL